MQHFLFDTSVYIAAIRKQDSSALSLRNLGPESPVWLSAVVLEELYAGVSSRKAHVIRQFQRNFEKVRRVLVPNLTDWSEAGTVLSRLAEKYGYDHIGRARLTNDALIAINAGRLGMEVITANERDFRRLAEFRSFQYSVIKV